ncbi:unnamed protein product [Lymnaea stagnalis]|uniref:Uncharacterized protein n=1 Tax=Lymnaea stagnalis TaxID=6523 RepID=A0AAV2H4A3_LYMST
MGHIEKQGDIQISSPMGHIETQGDIQISSPAGHIETHGDIVISAPLDHKEKQTEEKNISVANCLKETLEVIPRSAPMTNENTEMQVEATYVINDVTYNVRCPSDSGLNENTTDTDNDTNSEANVFSVDYAREAESERLGAANVFKLSSSLSGPNMQQRFFNADETQRLVQNAANRIPDKEALSKDSFASSFNQDLVLKNNIDLAESKNTETDVGENEHTSECDISSCQDPLSGEEQGEPGLQNSSINEVDSYRPALRKKSGHFVQEEEKQCTAEDRDAIEKTHKNNRLSPKEKTVSVELTVTDKDMDSSRESQGLATHRDSVHEDGKEKISNSIETLISESLLNSRDEDSTEGSDSIGHELCHGEKTSGTVATCGGVDGTREEDLSKQRDEDNQLARGHLKGRIETERHYAWKVMSPITYKEINIGCIGNVPSDTEDHQNIMVLGVSTDSHDSSQDLSHSLSQVKTEVTEASILSAQEEIHIPRTACKWDDSSTPKDVIEHSEVEASVLTMRQHVSDMDRLGEAISHFPASPQCRQIASDMGDGRNVEKDDEVGAHTEQVYMEELEMSDRLNMYRDTVREVKSELSPARYISDKDEDTIPLVKESKDGRRRVKKGAMAKQSQNLTDICSDSTVLTKVSDRPQVQKTRSADEFALLKSEDGGEEEGPDECYNLRTTKSTPVPQSGIRRIKLIDVKEFPKDMPCIYRPYETNDPKPPAPSASETNLSRPNKPITFRHRPSEARRPKKTSLWKRLKSILKAPRLVHRDGKFRFVRKYKKTPNSEMSAPSAYMSSTASDSLLDQCQDVSKTKQRGSKVKIDERFNFRPVTAENGSEWQMESPTKPLHRKKSSKRNEWRQFRRLRVLRHSAETMGPILPPMRTQNVSNKNYVRLLSENYQRAQESKYRHGCEEEARTKRSKKRRSKSRSSKRVRSPLLEHPKDDLAAKRCEMVNSATPEVFEVFCHEDEDACTVKEEPTVRMLLPVIKPSASSTSDPDSTHVADNPATKCHPCAHMHQMSHLHQDMYKKQSTFWRWRCVVM